MSDQEKTREQLLQEVEDLRSRLNEAEEALRAISHGEVDALVVSTNAAEQVYLLEGADHPYRVMVESINEGAATILPDGGVLYGNKRMAEMLGVPLESLLGSCLLDHFLPGERETFEALARKGAQGDGRAEFNLRRGDGSLVPVLLSVSRFEADHEPGICLIATDLTEHKHSEELASAERMARSILEQAAEAIVVCDSSGTIIRASQATNLILQQSPLFQPFAAMFPVELEGDAEEREPFSIQEVLGGKSFRGIEARLGFRPSGGGAEEAASYTMLLSASPLRNDRDEILGCIVSLTDITHRKEVEAARREGEIQHRLMDHREQERVQIARNLHDGPLQDVLGLSYTVQALVPRTEGQEISGDLEQVRASLIQLASDLRSVCNELRPPILARFGLAKAIRAHAEDFQAKNPAPKMTLELIEDGRSMPDPIRMALFRIYQECLNNILHHAGASEVTVRLAQDEESIRMEVQDDGQGFTLPRDWVEIVNMGHLGLVGMKERAEALGGRIAILSKPGKGTRIVVEIPRITEAS